MEGGTPKNPHMVGEGTGNGGEPNLGGGYNMGGAQMGGRTAKNEGGPQKWKGDPQISYVVGEGPGNGGVEG